MIDRFSLREEALFFRLNSKHIEVLSLTGKGFTPVTAAREMHTTAPKVGELLNQAHSRLRTQDSSSAVVQAVQLGILKLDDLVQSLPKDLDYVHVFDDMFPQEEKVLRVMREDKITKPSWLTEQTRLPAILVPSLVKSILNITGLKNPTQVVVVEMERQRRGIVAPGLTEAI